MLTRRNILYQVVNCSSDELDLLFNALGEPLRRGVVLQLSSGEKSLTDLLASSSLSMAGVMKHVAVLEKAGIVVSEKRGRTRYCRLRPVRLLIAEAWIAEATAFWTARLESLAKYLEEEAE